MGGFTSFGPAMAARALGAKVYLHEANSIPGRANRWLARWSDRAFTYFPQTGGLLGTQGAVRSGMPVRAAVETLESEPCRMALGLKPTRPVLLIMGGSQGAHAINEVTLEMAPALARRFPTLQFLHLSGARDAAKVQAFYESHGLTAVVRGFLTEMELALAAATVAISRAGASSLAEFAATGVPAVLIPYPSAANNHQLFNAIAFQESGAAEMLAPSSSDYLLEMISALLADGHRRDGIKKRIASWHFPRAAADIANAILTAMNLERDEVGLAGARPSGVEGEVGFAGIRSSRMES